MVTLVINPGSSNVKYALYKDSNLILNGELDNSIEAIGKAILTKIIKYGAVDKIAYRVVYSGKYTNHCVITKEVLNNLKKTTELDPMHMPQTIKLIEFFMKNTKAKHIACFDTVFHNTKPDVAKYYAVPWKLTKKYSIIRFGFHGLAHQAMAEKADCNRVITCQLGNGVSISAVKNGKCIDTSMGFTPLEGVMMATRSGNIDPSLIEFLCKKEKKSASEITRMLNKESGLKGISNDWDMRNILKRKDKLAKLAFDMFCYNVKKQIGAYIAALNGVDAIVFSGGISHDAKVRNRILSGLPNAKVLVYEADEQEVMFRISKRF